MILPGTGLLQLRTVRFPAQSLHIHWRLNASVSPICPDGKSCGFRVWLVCCAHLARSQTQHSLLAQLPGTLWDGVSLSRAPLPGKRRHQFLPEAFGARQGWQCHRNRFWTSPHPIKGCSFGSGGNCPSHPAPSLATGVRPWRNLSAAEATALLGTQNPSEKPFLPI